MKFSALPVKHGDAFLLNYNDFFVLVDGGKNKQHICSLLEKENISHIDVLICTHYDADHINGIIGILKSKKLTFKEIWLPEVLGSTAYTISKSHSTFLHALRKMEDVKEKNTLKSYDSEKGNNEDISVASLNLFMNFRYNYYLHSLMVCDKSRSNNCGEIITNLYSACSVVKKSLSSGASVRWFKYQNAETKNPCGYDMFAKNSIETGVTIYDPNQLAQALYLTTINKESLVFLFDNKDVPNVLFTADSDLSFVSDDHKINLKSDSIVTAPHHGSADNAEAYSRINGGNLNFVRSDFFNRNRPCDAYIKKENRYCTICNNGSGKKKKVTLEFDGSSIVPIEDTEQCRCTTNL